mmetsp:Transcript_33634/g.54141  ORF Transcript_33634/g.54141 Transcript_33634/m.54141 type:complete len:220 (+) Transcript_33634:1405-2064(+)
MRSSSLDNHGPRPLAREQSISYFAIHCMELSSLRSRVNSGTSRASDEPADKILLIFLTVFWDLGAPFWSRNARASIAHRFPWSTSLAKSCHTCEWIKEELVSNFLSQRMAAASCIFEPLGGTFPSLMLRRWQTLWNSLTNFTAILSCETSSIMISGKSRSASLSLLRASTSDIFVIPLKRLEFSEIHLSHLAFKDSSRVYSLVSMRGSSDLALISRAST